MHSVGTDIIEIERIEKALLRFGEKFLSRVFTEDEVKLYRDKPNALAARFAGKEAVIKTLGIKNIPWKDIEILPDDKGKPWVRLYRKAQSRADSLGLGEIAISLSHSREYATACAVAGVKRPYI
ncbi:MAG: holo-ACP synthase [Chloroflexota bacterium]